LSAALLLALVPGLLRYAGTSYVSGDTWFLVRQVREMVDHVGRGEWHTWLAHFALLQHLPAAVLVVAGLSDGHVYEGLVLLNLVVLAAVSVFAWWQLRRRSPVIAVIFLAVVLSGTILWYGHASFSELLAAALTLAMVVGLLDGAATPWIVLPLVGAAIAKDTSLPFVLILGLGTAFAAGRPQASWYQRLRLGPLALGGLLGAALVAGWNYLSFGLFFNPGNFNPQFFVPTLGIQVRFFLGIWLSPNGGVIPFWPTLSALLALALLAAVVDLRRAATWQERLVLVVPLAAVTVVLGGVSLGLSKWLAPMGWYAWGSRLMQPWLPAAAYLLAWSYADRISALIFAIRRYPLAILLPLGLAAATLPQYLVLFRGNLGDAIFLPGKTCPVLATIDNPDYYYQCAVHQLWSPHPVLLDAYQPNLDVVAFALAALCCLAWFWFTVRGVLAATRAAHQ
jgi:hypothetical protein